MKCLVSVQKAVFFSMISLLIMTISWGVAATELSEPDELHSVMPTQQLISGIHVGKDQIWIFPSKQTYMIGLPFKPDAKKRSEKFGRVEEQIRIPLVSQGTMPDWRGMFGDQEQQIVWGSESLQLLVLRKKDLGIVRSTSVPLDLLKPALDRGGEATKVEISRLRKSFHSAFIKKSGSRFTGVTEIPATWEKSQERNFLVASTVEGFSLMLMVCAKDDAASCVVTRKCILNGASASLNSHAAGLGVDLERREILIGNEKNNSIEIFKFKSCGDVRHISNLSLPKRMSKIGGLTIDDNARLWVTTGIFDSPFDANIFYWEKKRWQGFVHETK